MRIAVMGAGAVGAYYGARLAQAGHQVTLVARPAHVAAIQARGLWLDTDQGRDTITLAASTNAAAIAHAELVLCCVKANDTETAGAAMRPHLRPGACVLSLQNGVDNAERLAHTVGMPVAPTVVYVATELLGPGHVRHHGRGDLVLGPLPVAPATETAVLAAFTAAGIPVQRSDNVAGALWTKLVVNCAYNALSALGGRPYGPMVQSPGVWDVMRDAVNECLAVAQALGVQLPDDPWATVERIAHSMPTQSSSTAQDLRQGRRTEIDHLNGYVVRQGLALGIPTPVNRVLHSLVQLRDHAPR